VNAMKNVNIFFAAGETTFVVGRSGSGKSTIGQILAKFYNVNEGSVTLDGLSIQELDLFWLRQSILLVEQQSILFDGTIQENIAMSRYDLLKNLSKKEIATVIEASSFANIRQDIEAMPQKFETRVGSKGACLSGGQRQRIAIARAWLRNPPILILDESISGLDYVNRRAVIDAIRSWRKGKTTIIITHDILQILPDDFVYVMKDGYVVEEGYRKALESIDSSQFQDFLGTEEGEDEAPLEFNSFSPKSLTFPAHKISISNSPSQGDVGREITIDDILDGHCDEPGNRKSFKMTTIFSPATVLTQRRPSLQYPPIVAPFWKVMPPLVSSDWRSSHSRNSEGIFANEEATSTDELDLDVTNRLGCRLIKVLIRKVCCFSIPLILPWRNKSSNERPDRPETVALSERKHRHRKPSRQPQASIEFTMRRIIATILPQITAVDRIFLYSAIFSTVIFAISTPIFAFVFSKLMATLYNSIDRKANAMKYSLIVLAVSIMDGISIFVSQYLLQYCGQVWANSIRVNSLRLILAQPHKFFNEEENAVSRLSECLDQHGEEMQHILGRFLGYTLIVATMLTVAVLWSLAICWKLTLVLLASSPVIYAITNTLQAVTGEMDKRCASAAQNAGSVFTETFTNIKTVRSLTLEDLFREKHKEASDSVLTVGLHRAFLCGIAFGLSESMLFYLTALLFYYGSILLASGEFTLDAIIHVMTLLLFSVSNTTMILSAIPQVSIAREAAGRLLRLALLPEHCHEHSGTVRIHEIGDIVLHNVNFSYPSNPENRILKEVSFTIPSGNCIALVGLSGSGKSTIASLLLKLYPVNLTIPTLSSPSQYLGDITISNRSIKRIHTPTLRSLISIVTQTPTILPGTITDNIIYGLHKSSPLKSQTSIEVATRAAGIHEFIASLPQGYDTLVGEGGAGLSGGQAQRIAIARALVRQPKVLILDEATSALDVESAGIIRDTIRRLLERDRIDPEIDGSGRMEGGQGKLTVIIITHSRDMMRVADWICMLDKGQIVETGPYDELVRKGGPFAAMVRGRVWEVDEMQKKRESLLMMRRASGIVMDEPYGS
jgi:ATP-binding cassette, subfamily B (MDR/TAP), member 1